MKTDKLLRLITQSAPMREAGRLPLPRAQSGNSVQPYITSNPNDPRIQAYKDSLSLYNKGEKDFANYTKLNKTSNIPATSLRKWKDPVEYTLKNNKLELTKIQPIEGNGYWYEENPDVVADTNIPSRLTNNYTFRYKHPQQEVILNQSISKMPSIGFGNAKSQGELQDTAPYVPYGKPQDYMGPDGVWHQDYELPDNLKKGSNWRKQSGGTSWFNQQVVQDANARMNSVPTTTLGTPLSTPESRSYERRASYLKTHPEKYNTKDYRAGHKEEGLGNDIFSDPVAMAAALTAAGVGTGAVALSSIPRTFGTHLVDQATSGLSNFKNLLNIGKKSDYDGLIDLFNKANIDARNKYNITNFGETAGSAEDLANFKPGSYGAKLATDVFEGKYPMYSPTQNIHFNDLFDMRTGYTDIPSFNKQVNDLKIKLSHGKFPMEPKMNHMVTLPKDKFDYTHQNILGQRAVDYVDPDLVEYQWLFPTVSKELNSKEFNTLFPDKLTAREAYKIPEAKMIPNKLGGSTKIRLKRNG